MLTKNDLAVRDSRYEKTRKVMEKEGFDALLAVGHGGQRRYITYYTNYPIRGHYSLFLLPMEGEPAMTYSSYALARRVAGQGWVSDVRGGQNLFDDEMVPKIIDAMKEKGLKQGGRVGIAGFEYNLPTGTYLQLKGALPQVEFVNADDVIDRILAVKSPLEIKQIREIHKVVRTGFESFLDVLKPGINQIEAANTFVYTVMAEGARTTSASIGERGVLGPAQNVPMKCDDTVKLYPSAVGPGGHGNEQTLNCIGRDQTEFEENLMDSELKAYKSQRKMAKPGVRLSDLAREFDRVMRDEGWKWGAPRTGYDYHGIGERPAYAEVFNARPELWYAIQDWRLEAGMVINYHARRNYTAFGGQVTEFMGTGINEDILITENGAERLLGEDWEIRWRRI